MYMTQGLHRAIQSRPNDIAVRGPGQSLTFGQLADRVARLAGALQQLGLKDGERVALLSLNAVRYIEYDLAVPWAGGVLNPVNTRWSPAEILYSFDDSGTAILIVDETFKALGPQLARDAATIRHVIYAGDGETPEGMLDYETLIAQSAPVPDAHRNGDDLAGIFYTGGTTGFPKGVMLSHNNLCICAMSSLALGRSGRDAVYLHVMPMFHLADFAVTTSLLLSGGSHVVLPGFSPQQTAETIAHERVNEIMLAPTLIQMLVDWIEQNPEASGKLDLTCLKRLTYGASPISQTLLRRAQATFPGIELFQGYGMTELSPVATTLGPEDHTEEAFQSGRMKSAGKPALCAQVKIVDPQDDELPRGQIGEIAVRGPHVMLGYWNKPEATAEALRNGWMHTGDMGYMDEAGYVYVVDRLKDMIISGGENVYSAEVENALASHPAVAQSAVIGIPSQKWGEAVHAVVVLKPGVTATAESIQAHCKERIAGYKCPRSVEFRDALPVSGVGKVLKTELRKPYWDKQARAVA